MEKAQILAFVRKIFKGLDSDSRSISAKLIKEVQHKTFKCKISGNNTLAFDLELFDVTGIIEYHILSKSNSTSVSKKYTITLRNAGTESSFSATNQDKINGTENVDLYDALETLYHSIEQASEKNLSSDLDKLIKS